MSTKNKVIVSAILIALGVVCRLLPHAFNFAPIAGIALFCGVYLGKKYVLVVPAVSMLIGDIFLGFYSWPLMAAVYGSFIFAGGLGWLIRNHKSAAIILGSSVLASVVFFIFTNLAVWQFSGWYLHTAAGLIQAFTMALPFFRNTLLGDLFYTSVLFGAYESVRYLVLKKKLVIQFS